MRIATFEFSGSSFIYYSFHVLDIAQGLISLLDKSVELGADIDASVYKELESIVYK